MPRAVDILTSAAGLVGGDRDRQHGDKHVTFEKIAVLWTAYLQVRKEPAQPLSPRDVALMMVLLKMARTQNGAENPDDYIDAAGYFGCAGELLG